MKVYDKQWIDGRATTLRQERHHVYLFVGDVLSAILELEDYDVLGHLEERTDCLDERLMVDAILAAADELYGLPRNFGADHKHREDGFFDVWIERR